MIAQMVRQSVMKETSIACIVNGRFYGQFLRLIKMPKWLMLQLKMYAAWRFS
jgi:hypothetical protein